MVVAIAVASFATVIAFTVLLTLAQKTLEMAALNQLRDVASAAVGHLSTRLDEITNELQDLAADLPADNPSEQWSGRAQHSLATLPRLLRAALLVAPDGVPVEVAPVSGSPSLEGAWLRTLTERLRATRAPEWSGPHEQPQGSQVLLIAVPGPERGAGEPASGPIVVGVVDAAELVGSLPIPRTPSGDGALVVAREGGAIVGVGGSSAGLDGGLGDFLAAARTRAEEPASGGGRADGVLHERWAGRQRQLLGAVETTSGAAGGWLVASVLPRRVAFRPGSALFLFGGLVLVFLLAIAGALAVLAQRVMETPPESRLGGGGTNLGRDGEVTSEARLLLERSPFPLVVLQGGVVIGANALFLRRLEALDRSELIGKDLLDFVHPGERERTAKFLRGATGTKELSQRIETVLSTATNRPMVVELAANELGGAGVRQIAVAMRDLTSSERSEALLRTVAASDPRGLVLLDTAGNLLWANAAFGERTGCAVNELRGRSLLPVVAAPDRRRLVAMFGRAARGHTVSGQARIGRAGGGEYLAEVQASPVQVRSGPVGVLFVGRAIAAPQAPPVASARLSTVVANFGAVIAHRLNNDFQALLGLLERRSQLGEVVAYRDEIAALVGNAAEELQKLVAVGRAGSTGLRLLRLGGLMERWTARATARMPASVRLTVRREATDDRVLGDALQLGLFLDLSLSAATAAIELGGGALEVGLEDLREAGAIRLFVSDTGGLADTSADLAERTGAQLLPARDAAMAVAEIVAERHGGRAGSKRRPGLGSRIWVDIPLYRGEVVALQPAAEPRGEGVILVADDEEIVRQTLAGALRERGHEVIEASNGLEVVERVAEKPDRFDLVVLDLVMPVLDGRKAFARVRELAPTLKVLVCTGYEKPGDDIPGGGEAIIKPFGVDEFIERVEELLSRRGGAASGGTIKT